MSNCWRKRASLSKSPDRATSSCRNNSRYFPDKCVVCLFLCLSRCRFLYGTLIESAVHRATLPRVDIVILYRAPSLDFLYPFAILEIFLDFSSTSHIFAVSCNLKVMNLTWQWCNFLGREVNFLEFLKKLIGFLSYFLASQLHAVLFFACSCEDMYFMDLPFAS